MSRRTPHEDAESVLASFHVSRETRERLEILVSELQRWQKAKNLVGPGTLETVWSRHIADSLQLVALAPDARVWLDLGSGAGFPGLVVAIAIRDRAGARVHCVESNGRKCSFLRHAARVTEAPVTVHNARIEDVMPTFVGKVDVVTARALAPLRRLLDWAAPLLTTGVEGLFPKGDNVLGELTEARESWKFTVDMIPSRTDPRGQIMRIGSLEMAQPAR
jgi:16S rRNA (guanine527-N7)-methyltransferase